MLSSNSRGTEEFSKTVEFSKGSLELHYKRTENVEVPLALTLKRASWASFRDEFLKHGLPCTKPENNEWKLYASTPKSDNTKIKLSHNSQICKYQAVFICETGKLLACMKGETKTDMVPFQWSFSNECSCVSYFKKIIDNSYSFSCFQRKKSYLKSKS